MVGDYLLRVSARGQGQLGPAESTRTITYGLTNGCLENSTYDLLVSGSYTENEPSSPFGSGGCDLVDSGRFQRSVQAIVNGEQVRLVGDGYDELPPLRIISATASGFTAQASDDFGFDCGNYLPGATNSGEVTLNFDCASATVTFTASCVSDFDVNGCYPDYIETATGSGTRNVQCQPGYHAVAGKCVDIDECTAGSPCAGAETCTNTPGSFSCSCDSPAKLCDGACVNADTDFLNCGACGTSCADGQVCSGGACVTASCPPGYTSSGGTCVDINECALHACDPNADCVNWIGSYACVCNHGFSGDGKTCTDIDECAGSVCVGAQTCTNLPGSYTCACDAPALTCNSTCVDPSKDRYNCGGCGLACPAHQVCADGACVPGTGTGCTPCPNGSLPGLPDEACVFPTGTSASGPYYQSSVPARAIDGDGSTTWGGGSYDATIVLSLPAPTTMSKLVLYPDYWPRPDITYTVRITAQTGTITTLSGTFKSVPPYWLEMPLPSPIAVTRIEIQADSAVTWIGMREVLYEDCESAGQSR